VSELVLQVEDLVKEFPIKHLFRPNETVAAVDHVSFEVHRGQAVGLVGESGSGKSTTARCIIRLLDPTSGRVLFNGQDVANASGPTLKQLRRSMQIVFQDPFSSLNPRLRVETIISEGIRIHHLVTSDEQRRRRVLELLDLVGLEPDHLRRKPASFSGGQLQRIGIARALAVDPELLICDEPVSSLDVSIQAQILNLFRKLQLELNLTMLFIAHDLATVRHLCDYIVVMQEGKVVEQGPRDRIYGSPQHPYTRDLMAAVPVPDPDLERERREARKVLAAELTAAQAATDAEQAESSV
jgi:ABC-type oligopeptide transport system ATPase subunit